MSEIQDLAVELATVARASEDYGVRTVALADKLSDQVDKVWSENIELTIERDTLKAEVERLTKLAYLGDHHFEDLTYKARLEEALTALATRDTCLANMNEQVEALESRNTALEEVIQHALLNVKSLTGGDERRMRAALDATPAELAAKCDLRDFLKKGTT